MSKTVKKLLIAFGILVLLIAVDSTQALLLNNSPVIKIRENINNGILLHKDSGLFVDTFIL